MQTLSLKYDSYLSAESFFRADTSDLQLSSIIKDLASLIAIAAFCIGAGWLLVGVASSGGAI